MQRIEQQQLIGFSSTHILGEMAHRLMTMEAASMAGWSASKVSQRLKQHPTALQHLTRFQTAIDAVLQSRIQILTIPPLLIAAAARVSRQVGLLTNDAITTAVMKHNGLTNIATVDADFDRVPGLTRHSPA